MNAILASLTFLVGFSVILFVPEYEISTGALAVCAVVFSVVVIFIYKSEEVSREFLLQVFVAGLLVRIALATIIYFFKLENFFGGDAYTYDAFGYILMRVWQGDTYLAQSLDLVRNTNFGMIYIVAVIYRMVGRNMLAIQFFNSVLGAATAPLIYLSAKHIFQNIKVAKISAFFVAFYPSIILWSCQGLKDGPIIFLLVVCIFVTLKLGQNIKTKYVIALVGALIGIFSLRFYLFYMVMAAIGGSFIIGMRPITIQSFLRQLLIVIAIGLSMTYLGILRMASGQLESFGSLQAVQNSRSDLAQATSGFGRDIDVSTTEGAIKTIPIGIIYLLFAPFPWELVNLRQSITLPEMAVWWLSFPLLIVGLWFTLKYRLRQALPILIFITMLTLAYSIFQGNVGTAYRQRSQLLVFYFIFVAVGIILFKEKNDERRQKVSAKPYYY